ncbi:DsbA family protein [uncultured Shewanella sp.]|uniref:DsbA family protein n=1 Tax=Shewanella atlantica TaxID=271099 RepID=UPI00261903BE|nr:DsbA family protein [uncultured Shewanella sp.]
MGLESPVRLYYVYDPMCSWCWGYAPTWLKLQAELQRAGIEVEYRLGGLAPDSDEPMAEDMQRFLEQTWQQINRELGTEFNHDFWQLCNPRRSTYPACRAALIARASGLEQAMVQSIQQAYYLEARNPSDIETLTDIAASIGLDADRFTSQIHSNSLDRCLMEEIDGVRRLPIRGFPSLVLEHGGELTPIPLDYKRWQISFNAVAQRLC